MGRLNPGLALTTHFQSQRQNPSLARARPTIWFLDGPGDIVARILAESPKLST